jgi:hypothetical protein
VITPIEVTSVGSAGLAGSGDGFRRSGNFIKIVIVSREQPRYQAKTDELQSGA